MAIQTSKQLEGALINGRNQILSGDIRSWHSVRATGRTRQNKLNQTLTEVIDPTADYKLRWLNMGTLTGQVILSNNIVQTWVSGSKTGIRSHEGVHKQNEIGHYLELVKRFFKMNNEQLGVFLEQVTDNTLTELIAICKTNTKTEQLA